MPRQVTVEVRTGEELTGCNRRYVIIGASGSLGHQLFTECVGKQLNVVGTAFRRTQEGLLHFDLLGQSIAELIPDLGPRDCVYLLSAYTRPDWIFGHSQKSRALNVEALQHTADQVLSRGARLVFVSSSMVFDGASGGYRETDRTSPTTLYGKQKVEVENFLRQSAGNWCIIRTNSTITHRLFDNCPTEKTYQTLWSRKAKMATDNFCNLTDVADVTRILAKLANRRFTGVYHVAALPPVSSFQLAEWIQGNSIFAKEMSSQPVRFSELSLYPEPRPRCSFLDNSKVRTQLEESFESPRESCSRHTNLNHCDPAPLPHHVPSMSDITPNPLGHFFQ